MAQLFDAWGVLGSTRMFPSSYIKTMHPKTEIRNDPATFRRILNEGWWGQVKIHGHRVQIHLNADPSLDSLAFNRHGRLHARTLDAELEAELRRLLPLNEGWSAVEAEWLKPEKHLYLFDFVKWNDKSLGDHTYEERYRLLPRVYQSQTIETLDILRSVDECIHAFETDTPHHEGLVFKSRHTPGFPNSAIIRCRKSDHRR